MPGNNQIALSLNPLQLEDPISQYAKVARVQNMIQQGREHAQRMDLNTERLQQERMQTQEAKRATAEQELGRQAITQAGGDLPRARAILGTMPGVSRDTLTKFDDEIDKHVSSLAKQEEEKYKNYATKSALIDDSLRIADAEPDDAKAQQVYTDRQNIHLKNGLLKPEEASPWIDRADLKRQIAASTAVKQTLAMAGEKRAQATADAAAKEAARKDALGEPQLVVEREKAAAAKAAQFAREHPEDAQAQAAAMTAEQRASETDKKLTRENAAKTTDIRDYEYDVKRGYKGPIGQWRNEEANRRRPITNNIYTPIAGMPAAQPTGNAKWDTVLDKYPEPVRAAAQGFLTYSVPMPTGQRATSTLVQGAFQAAREADPTFDPKIYPQRQRMMNEVASGRGMGAEVGAINTTIGHLGDLNEAITALKNKDVQVLNRIANAWGVQTGNSAVPVYEAIVHRVAPEVVRAYVGTGGDVADRKKAEDDFNPSRGPDQLHPVVKTTLKLLDSKIDTTLQRWKGVMGDKPFPLEGGGILTPKAKASRDKILGGGGSGLSGLSTEELFKKLNAGK